MAKLTAEQTMRIKIGARIIEQYGMQSFWAFVAANKAVHEQKLQARSK